MEDYEKEFEKIILNLGDCEFPEFQMDFKKFVKMAYNKISMISSLTLEDVFKYFIKYLNNTYADGGHVSFSYNELVLLCSTIQIDLVVIILLGYKSKEVTNINNIIESINKSDRGGF